MNQNINYKRKISIIGLWFGLFQLSLFGQSLLVNEKKPSTFTQLQTSVTTKIDSYLKPYVEMKDFSGVLFIVRNNQILFNKSYGKANYETNTPILSNTRFRIGSISKQFTAASIILLHKQGKLSLNDKLSNFIPDFPKGDQITLSMLLNHTAGLARDLANEPGYLQVPRTTEELVDIIKKKDLITEPGKKASYSNNGYRILVYVIEKVSGRDLKSFLSENFFNPLGMKNTGQDTQRDLVSNRADGYIRWFNESLINAPFTDISNDIGSGGLYSSAEDLYKWDKSLHDGKILSRVSVRQMVAEGYGIGEKKIANHKSIGHDGRLTGFTSFNDYYPDDNTYIIFLSNIESGAVADIRKDLPAILFNEPYTKPAIRPTAAKFNPQIINSYVGRYEVFPGFTLTIKKAPDGLILGSAEGFYPMIAESEIKFFFPLRYAEITFVKNSEGTVSEMKWKEFGSEFRCKKVN